MNKAVCEQCQCLTPHVKDGTITYFCSRRYSEIYHTAPNATLLDDLRRSWIDHEKFYLPTPCPYILEHIISQPSVGKNQGHVHNA